MKGAKVVVRDLEVENDGWVPVPIKGDAEDVTEADRVRGFVLDRREAASIEVRTAHHLLSYLAVDTVTASCICLQLLLHS